MLVPITVFPAFFSSFILFPLFLVPVSLFLSLSLSLSLSFSIYSILPSYDRSIHIIYRRFFTLWTMRMKMLLFRHTKGSLEFVCLPGSVVHPINHRVQICRTIPRGWNFNQPIVYTVGVFNLCNCSLFFFRKFNHSRYYIIKSIIRECGFFFFSFFFFWLLIPLIFWLCFKNVYVYRFEDF